MSKADIEAIKAAKRLKKYCKGHTCIDCVFMDFNPYRKTCPFNGQVDGDIPMNWKFNPGLEELTCD